MLNTPDKIQANSKKTKILNLKVKRNFQKNLNALVFNAQAGAVTDKTLYDLTIELYPLAVHEKVYRRPGMDTDAWVSCSCPYFLFHCEYALAKKNSSEINYSDGRKPLVTNPDEKSFLCKHLYAAAPIAVKAAQDVTKRDTEFGYV